MNPEITDADVLDLLTKGRRNVFAGVALAGLLAARGATIPADQAAESAVTYADALIRKLDSVETPVPIEAESVEDNGGCCADGECNC